MIYPRELIKTLENRGLTVQNSENGIHLIAGDIVPIQILESKNLSKEENLFLRTLRSNLSGADMQKTLETYKERKPLDNKNLFLDRLIKANPQCVYGGDEDVYRRRKGYFPRRCGAVWMVK